MENRYFRQGYVNCILDFKEFNLEHCKIMVEEMKGECEFSQLVKGYEWALVDIEDGVIKL